MEFVVWVAGLRSLGMYLRRTWREQRGAWGLVLVVASGLVCTGECPASILLLGEVPGVWR